jgi:subtilisin
VADVGIFATGGDGDWYGEAISDSEGVARLNPPPTMGTASTLLAEPLAAFWGAYRTNVSTRRPIALDLAPVDSERVDALRFYYGTSAFDPCQGVKIGVIDDGVDEHRDLEVAGGQNTVIGEQDGDFSSASRQGHGTHVAGIIAAATHRPMGIQGVAPGASVRSYRVFPGDGWLATNYSIVKALMAAQVDGCDIVNLSLETSEEDQVVADAVEDAREHGVAIVAAAGNGGGQPVTQPGSCSGAIAVAAFGREGTFPADSSEARHVSSRRGSDPSEFVATFSNCGPGVICIAPGVGIVSTLPGNTYGPRSGTSMAAPIVTGVVASLLSRSPSVLSMARCRARARAIESLLAAAAMPSGFGLEYEGLGRPRCQKRGREAGSPRSKSLKFTHNRAQQ